MADQPLPHTRIPTSEEVSELDRLLLLTEVADSVDGFANLKLTIDRLCESVVTVMQCAYACVRLPNDEGTALRTMSSSDPEAFIGDEFLDLTSGSMTGPVPGHRPPSVDAFLTGRLQIVSRADTDGGDAPWQQHFRRLGIISMLSLPLVRRSTVLGVLNCYWIEEFTPDEAQLLTLQVVGRLSALAVESARRAEVVRSRVGTEIDARSRSEKQNAAIRILTSFHAELIERAAQPPAEALSGITRALSYHLDCAAVIVDTHGEILAMDGPADAVGTLTGDGEVSPDSTTLHINDVYGPLGTLRLSRDTSNPEVTDFITFAKQLLVPVLARRIEDRTSSRIARPYALATLCSGLLDTSQTSVVTEVLGTGSHAQLQIAVARFASPVGALHFSSHTLQHARSWEDVIASAAIGDSVVILLGQPSPRRNRSLNPDEHPGLVGVGISEAFTGVTRFAAFLAQARYASSTVHDATTVTFADLGPSARLCLRLPRAEVQAMVDGRLGVISRYDDEHRTELVRTLEVFVSSNGSAEQSAEALFIHKNTVLQRLRKIADLSGLDLHSYSDLTDTVMVLQWKKFLDATEHRSQ